MVKLLRLFMFMIVLEVAMKSLVRKLREKRYLKMPLKKNFILQFDILTE